MKKTNHTDLIWQSKKLPRLNSRLGLNELKVLQCFIGQLEQGDKKFIITELSVNEIVHSCGFKGESRYCYEQVERATEKLKKCVLEYRPGEYYELGDHSETVKWFEIIDYKNGFVKYKFNDVIKEDLLGLHRHREYINYAKRLLPFFETPYGLRLYLILKGDSNNIFAYFEPDEIKSMLCLTNAYSPKESKYAIANQNNRIIKPAIDEINRLSDIFVKCVPKKRGRQVIGWDFIIIGKYMLDGSLDTTDIENIEVFTKEISKRIKGIERWEEVIKIAKNQKNKYCSAWVLKVGENLKPQLLKDYDNRWYRCCGDGYSIKNEIARVLLFGIGVLNDTPPEQYVRGSNYIRKDEKNKKSLYREHKSKLSNDEQSKDNIISPFDEPVPF